MSNSEQIKIVIIGEANVGKSSILVRYIADSYQDTGNPTIGVAFLSKDVTIRGINVSMNIWDTAGQERFGSLAKMYSRDANAIILVYDITSKATFEKMKAWYHSLQQEKFDEGVIFAIAGNKEDLCCSEEVSYEEALEFAESVGAIYKKTSAKQNVGISELFNLIAQRYLNVSSCRISETIVLSKYSKSDLKHKKNCC